MFELQLLQLLLLLRLQLPLLLRQQVGLLQYIASYYYSCLQLPTLLLLYTKTSNIIAANTTRTTWKMASNYVVAFHMIVIDSNLRMYAYMYARMNISDGHF